MSKLPSFEQFNESLQVANINEGVFHRLPKGIISDELYLTTKNLQNFYDRTAAGNDVDPVVIDTIIRGLDKIKKAVKRFNSKEEVTGTVYEAEKMVFDEIGTELEALQKKILELMKNTTDSKWRTALGSASTALSNLDRNLSQADAKLGVIPMKESEMNEGDMTKFYDGFIVLDFKNKETYKFKYIKGISNAKVEVDAINKLVKATGISQANFTVRGFVKKGEWNKDDTPVFESTVNEASVQVAGSAKPSGAQVLATVIIDALDKKDFLHPDTKKSHKQLIEMVKQVIMDSTF
jgi:hypothetical protein